MLTVSVPFPSVAEYALCVATRSHASLVFCSGAGAVSFASRAMQSPPLSAEQSVPLDGTSCQSLKVYSRVNLEDHAVCVPWYWCLAGWGVSTSRASAIGHRAKLEKSPFKVMSSNCNCRRQARHPMPAVPKLLTSFMPIVLKATSSLAHPLQHPSRLGEKSSTVGSPRPR